LAQVTRAVAYSSRLRQFPALEPSGAAQVSKEPVASPQGSGTAVFPCPTCGETALSLLGETRHSIVLQCAACRAVSVERRR
jgi:predicted RNA-binding Zn-ribbon protein involved in translation (DUF1610 family)